jgi:integrase
MNYTTLSLEQLVPDATAYLVEAGYSEKTIAQYKCRWKKLLKHCNAQGIKYFSYEVSMEFIMKEYKILPNQKLKNSQVFSIRCIKCLDDFAKYGHFQKCHQPSGREINETYEPLLTSYLKEKEAEELMPRTIQGKRIQLTAFLNDIYNHGIACIELLSADLILQYVGSLKGKGYSNATRSGILFTLRDFLIFLFNNHYIEMPLQNLFPVIFSNKHERIPSYYFEDEIREILIHIDRDFEYGKRDYLILLLAVQLGLRAGDIRMLKLEQIHWEKGTIELIQQKTGNPLQLPLLDNIKFALIDYIRNSRPQSDSTYIFVRHRAPHTPYTNSNVFFYVISRYLKEAKVDISNRKHGLHSMRHSLASNLLKNNTPYPVITGILGHENSSTTRFYLNIDLEQLRSVALEVPYEG